MFTKWFYGLQDFFLLDLGLKEATYSCMRNMFFQKLPKLVVFESGKCYKFTVRRLKYEGVVSSLLFNLVSIAD